MKLKKSELKTCRVAYLYHDGHCVLVHEKRDKDAGKVEWVTIYESIGIETRFDKPGRLIIDPAALPFIQVAKSIRVSPPSVSAGSENTRKMGIAVEHIELRNGNNRPWFISNFPGIISSDIYFNDNDTAKFNPECTFRWSDYPVKSVYRNE